MEDLTIAEQDFFIHHCLGVLMSSGSHSVRSVPIQLIIDTLCQGQYMIGSRMQ